MSLLEVDGLRGLLPGAGGLLTVVDGVDYRVEEGEVFGVAGESGSGKTMSMLALLGVLPDGAAVEGRVRFDGRDLMRLSSARRRAPRARAARAGAHPGRAGGTPRLPASILRWDASADRNCDRPRLPPEAA